MHINFVMGKFFRGEKCVGFVGVSVAFQNLMKMNPHTRKMTKNRHK